jgi:hypothetical protein
VSKVKLTAWVDERTASAIKGLAAQQGVSVSEMCAQMLRRGVEPVMETEKGRDPVFAQRGTYGLYAALLGAKTEGAPALAYMRELTAEGR